MSCAVNENVASAWPPRTASVAGPPPSNGMLLYSTPAALAIIRMGKSAAPHVPELAKLNFPGFFFM